MTNSPRAARRLMRAPRIVATRPPALACNLALTPLTNSPGPNLAARGAGAARRCCSGSSRWPTPAGARQARITRASTASSRRRYSASVWNPSTRPSSSPSSRTPATTSNAVRSIRPSVEPSPSRAAPGTAPTIPPTASAKRPGTTPVATHRSTRKPVRHGKAVAITHSAAQREPKRSLTDSVSNSCVRGRAGRHAQADVDDDSASRELCAIPGRSRATSGGGRTYQPGLAHCKAAGAVERL